MMGECRQLFLLIFVSVIWNQAVVNGWWACCNQDRCGWKWGSCSRSCGGGTRTAIKTHQDGPCGSCDMPLGQHACNVHCCPANCYWHGWHSWSACSASCGSVGVRLRTRTRHGPSCGGAQCGGNSMNTQPCNRHCCPVHCSWSTWVSWGTCSVTCGGGNQSRRRVIGVQNQCGGNNCVGGVKESRSCGTGCCAVHCSWANWQPWKTCSTTCGGGTQSRRRDISVRQQCGGNDCAGDDDEIRPCSTGCCPVHCSWADWQPWETCSTTCGGGTQSRRRDISVQQQCGGNDCAGVDDEIRPCSTGCCPVHCSWGDWQPWETCSTTCGGGTQSRRRDIGVEQQCGGDDCAGDDDEARTCSTRCCPIDCALGEWRNWSACSRSCGGGLEIRQRSKTVNESCDGQCVEPLSEQRPCNDDCCVIDCKWDEWGKWGACSKSCDIGAQTRIRNVSVKACGGNECEGSGVEEQTCEEFCCPGDCFWYEWGGWTTCSTTCGLGERFRLRGVEIGPNCESRNCPESTFEKQTCRERCCSVDCEMSVWTQWSECSSTCGARGIQSRNRNITQEMECNGAPCEGNLHQEESCTRLCHNGGVVESERCICLDGWTGECCDLDIDECELDRRLVEQLHGSIRGSGSSSGTGDTLSESDQLGSLHCHKFAFCTNTPGGYSCNCRAGYSGDGILCDDIDECELDLHNCRDEHMTCIDTDGGFECGCDEGYQMSGQECQERIEEEDEFEH